MIALLLACAAPEEVEATAFAPELGAWVAAFGDTWGGDCALEDPHTYQPAEQIWELDAYRYGFSVLDEEGYWLPCALTDRAFVCTLPVIADDFRSFGVDIQATYTPTWEGEFTDATHLTGAYKLDVVCEGADCGLLTGYGPDFTTPCTAETPLEAEASPG